MAKGDHGQMTSILYMDLVESEQSQGIVVYSPSFTRAVAIEAVLRRTVDGFGVRRHQTMTETKNGDTVPDDPSSQ